MSTDLIVVKGIHYAALIAILWASFMKNMLLTPREVSTETIRKVSRFDKLSGIAAALLLVSGLSMLYWFAKPTSYYLNSPLFQIKIAIFVIASVLIIFTKIYLKKSKAAEASVSHEVPAHVRFILRFDFVGLLALTSLGYLLARGFGG